MKRIIIFLIIIFLFFTACTKRKEEWKADLYIYNQTDHTLWYKIDGSAPSYIDSRVQKLVSIDIPGNMIGITEKTIQISYGYESEIIDTENFQVKYGESRSYVLYLPHCDLRLFNNTNAPVTGLIEYPNSYHNGYMFSVNPHTSYTYLMEIPGSLDGIDSVQVSLYSEGSHLLTNTSMLTLNAYDSTNVYFEATAGCFEVHNVSYSLNITQFYVAPINSQNWGESALHYYLHPGQTEEFPIAPGVYDIKLYDNQDHIYILHDQTITLDAATEIIFMGGDAPFLNRGLVTISRKS